MYSMFEYLTNKQSFVIALGNYISKEVQKHKEEETINQLDRERLAEDFYSKIHPSKVTGAIDRVDVIEDIAMYIDRRLPQAYIKWSRQRHDINPSKVNVALYEHNLVYHYRHESKQSKHNDR